MIFIYIIFGWNKRERERKKRIERENNKCDKWYDKKERER